jgi:5-methyltetrahydrofolate--homocysteine methyltransferase
MLQLVIDNKWIEPTAVVGIFEANSTGDDIELNHQNEKYVLHTLRQQIKKAGDEPNYALSDFIKPKESENEGNLTPNPSPKERGTESPQYYTSPPKDWNRNIENAKFNRKNPTKAESLMWELLRNKKLGFKFRRQHLVNGFIPDFICIEKMLIVEIDGEIHLSIKEHDIWRENELKQLGYQIIRFTNDEVFYETNRVIESIRLGLNNSPLSFGEGQGGEVDYIGAFALQTGSGVDIQAKVFESNHDDYSAIMLKAVADRLAEAFAELLHEKVRKEIWGYASNESLSIEQLIKENYEGIRPAPGYPAQPDHTEKKTIWKLLDVQNNIGLELTDSMAMYPTAAVSGLYFAHAQSKYFAINKLSKDQLHDYATRKNMSIEECERWLGPWLGY